MQPSSELLGENQREPDPEVIAFMVECVSRVAKGARRLGVCLNRKDRVH